MAEEAPAGGGTPGLDMEALSKTLAPMINESINRTIGARLNRDSLGKLIEEKIGAVLGGDSLSKLVESAITKMVEDAPASEDPGTTATPPSGNSAGKGNGAGTKQDDPQIAELKKQLEAVRKAQQAAETKAAEKERALTQQAAQAKEQRLIAHARTELSKVLGGNDAMAAVLAKDLVKDRKWVDEGPDGSFVWNVAKTDGLGNPAVEAMAFAEGLKAWASTDEGKALVPARPHQVNMPPVGMPFPNGFPMDRSGALPSSFGAPNGQPRVTNPVAAQMAVDSAQYDQGFAAHLMQHATLTPVDKK